MNVRSIIQFRRQVEDVIREQLALAEWERSQDECTRETYQQHMQNIALDLERNLKVGVRSDMAEEHFQMLEKTSQALERQQAILDQHDQKISQLRAKLHEAYQARRALEIVQSRREAARIRRENAAEQKEQDDLAGFRCYQSGYQEASCDGR